MDVQLYELAAVRFQESDFQPDLLAEFRSLPLLWTDDPLRFDSFVKRWGTHYIKSSKVGGSFVSTGKMTSAIDADKMEIAAQALRTFTASIAIDAKVNFRTKDQSRKFDSLFDYHAVGGDPVVGAMLASAIQDANENQNVAKQGRATANVATAARVWLESLKVAPSLYNIKCTPIYDLLLMTGTDIPTKQRCLALQQAFTIYLQEPDQSVETMDGGVMP